MREIDFSLHNEEQRLVWESFNSGNPIRVPMTLGINPRYTMWNYGVNTNRYNFQTYFDDPEVMLSHILENAYFVRHNVPYDTEMGLPSEAWDVNVDFQNVYEAAWFGCEVKFPDNQVPFAEPLYRDEDSKYKVFDFMPEPYAGLLGRGRDYYNFFLEKQKSGYEYFNRPIRPIGFPGMGTDGPLTVCCDIRGTTEFMTDLVCDTEYALRLLDFVTEATINRILTYRRDLGQEEMAPGFGFADDNIELLSSQMYKDLILPFHKRLRDATSLPGSVGGIHICGRAQHHHKVLTEELNIVSIDTGFPMDFEHARDYVTEETVIMGGPSVPFLETHNYEDVYQETLRILNSGVADTGKFVLREANNLPGSTPIENIWAMYDCVREFKIK